MNGGLYSSRTDEWATPSRTFQELDAEFHFTLDPCATNENHKCPRYFTKEQNGLIQNWGGAEGILQSSIRKGDKRLGAKMLGGKPKAGHYDRDAYTRPNGYRLLPRLYLPQGAGGPFYSRASAL